MVLEVSSSIEVSLENSGLTQHIYKSADLSYLIEIAEHFLISHSSNILHKSSQDKPAFLN